MPDNEFVAHGSEWAEHEDHLVGNTAGLKRLRESIDQAIETGVSEIAAGEFVGVKCLPDEFFKAQDQKSGGNTSGVLFIIGLVIVAIVFFAGLSTIGSCALSLF